MAVDHRPAINIVGIESIAYAPETEFKYNYNNYSTVEVLYYFFYYLLFFFLHNLDSEI